MFNPPRGSWADGWNLEDILKIRANGGWTPLVDHINRALNSMLENSNLLKEMGYDG